MRKVAIRVVLVAVVQLLLLEMLLRLEVHWRESTGELWTMAHGVGLLIGCVWALVPGFAHIGSLLAKVCLRGVAGLALFVALYAGDYCYSWHLRPNLGLYQEPDWVAQHPGFQRELRERIQANMWKPQTR